MKEVKNYAYAGLLTLAAVTLTSGVVLCGCSTNVNSTSGTNLNEQENPNGDETSDKTNRNEEEDMEFNQMDMPKSGETIAIMHTTMGDIKIRLFPQYAPKTVENFITLAKEGKYDDVIFHRVIDDFMIQGGDYENGDGTGGKSIYGDGFADELDEHVLLYRGALAMANRGRGTNSNGSQFFIVQTKKVDNELIKQIKSAGIPKEYYEGYEKYGGTPHLDFRFTYNAHTVFGQVYEGLNVVDSIAQTEVDSSDRPINDIKIKSIDIEVVE